ncbi:MAG: 16S rRNA processing protein RimM, partial [Caulobacterales bacterium 32-67-6]
MPDKLIQVARVAGAFGVRGELRITTFTEDPMSLSAFKALLRQDGSPALTLTSARPVKGGVVARAKEIETREQAEAARGLRLFIPREA